MDLYFMSWSLVLTGSRLWFYGFNAYSSKMYLEVKETLEFKVTQYFFHNLLFFVGNHQWKLKSCEHKLIQFLTNSWIEKKNKDSQIIMIINQHKKVALTEKHNNEWIFS